MIARTMPSFLPLPWVWRFLGSRWGDASAVLVGITAAAFVGAQHPQHRPYWPVTVDQLAAGTVKHTHVQVTGRVRLIRLEEDGDMHFKLTGVTGFIVAECMPDLACPSAAGVHVGDRVTVEGVSRYDAEHKWWEVHPVESLTKETGPPKRPR